MKKQKTKKQKKEPIPKIKRRILKIWSEIVRGRDDFTCAYCGLKRGTIVKGKKIKCDAHHTLSKDIKNTPLKYDIVNGITLCSSHHKFSNDSAHKSPIVFYDWYKKNYPNRYEYVLNNSHHRVDLENRKVLEEIEACLKNKTSLNIEKLKQIESEFPRRKKKKFEIKGSLFDTDNESSSSSD